MGTHIGRRVAAVAALGLSFGIVSSAQAQNATAPADSPATYTLWPKWGPYLDVGGLVGTQRNIGGVDLFVPFAQNERSMMFGDVRLQADDKSSVEGNFGMGFRHMLEGGWTPGVYGYYDHRKASTGNVFDQFTVGAELLGTNFDFRANYYAPFGQTQQLQGTSTAPATAQVVGASLLVTEPGTMATYAYALRGFDAEAGWRIPITAAESPYATRFYAGAYRFDEPSGVVPVVAGPRLRLEFTDYDLKMWAGSRFTAELEWQTDQVRGSQAFAGLRLRIPLQAPPAGRALSMQEQRMTDPIVRDVDIVAQSATIQQTPTVTEPATALANGGAFTVINSSSTSGNNLATAVTNAGNGSTVILSGAFQVTGTNGISLAFNQSLMAGNIAVRTASGHVATLTTSATIAGTNVAVNGTLVQVNAGGTLQGLTITNAFSGGTGGSAVLIAGASTGVNILNNTITVTQSGANVANALALGGAVSPTAATISGNTLTATGSGTATTMNALIANQPNQTATVSGNTFNATGGTTNRIILSGAHFNAGSTGNIRGSGTCSGVPASGAVSFTDGTSC